MNGEYDKIISTLNYDHYFDRESWFQEVLKTDCDCIVKDGFGIIIEYRVRFGLKIGHSRGGVRFDRNAKSFEEYLKFLEYLKNELYKLNYVLVGIDFMEPENAYTQVIEKDDVFREAIPGTVVIYPKENWLQKFNSKKRYDLTYAQKKGFADITIYSNVGGISEIPPGIIDQLYGLIAFAYTRHQSSFPIPTAEVFRSIFDHVPFILAVAMNGEKCLAFNLSIYNSSGTRVERVYAGAGEEALKMRLPSAIEVVMVEYLHQKGVTYYDLWGIKKDDTDGVTAFKKSLGDEAFYFPEYGIIKVRSGLAAFFLRSMKLSRRVKNMLKGKGH